jgi:preprotein translocase subunit SecG
MLDAILMFVAIVLILLTLLQSGKSDGISSAFSGGSGGLNLFSNVKERGPEKIIANLTLLVGSLFFILVIVIRVINK